MYRYNQQNVKSDDEAIDEAKRPQSIANNSQLSPKSYTKATRLPADFNVDIMVQSTVDAQKNQCMIEQDKKIGIAEESEGESELVSVNELRKRMEQLRTGYNGKPENQKKLKPIVAQNEKYNYNQNNIKRAGFLTGDVNSMQSADSTILGESFPLDASSNETVLDLSEVEIDEKKLNNPNRSISDIINHARNLKGLVSKGAFDSSMKSNGEENIDPDHLTFEQRIRLLNASRNPNDPLYKKVLQQKLAGSGMLGVYSKEVKNRRAMYEKEQLDKGRNDKK